MTENSNVSGEDIEKDSPLVDADNDGWIDLPPLGDFKPNHEPTKEALELDRLLGQKSGTDKKL